MRGCFSSRATVSEKPGCSSSGSVNKHVWHRVWPFPRRSLILVRTSQHEGRGSRLRLARTLLSAVWSLCSHAVAPALSSSSPRASLC